MKPINTLFSVLILSFNACGGGGGSGDSDDSGSGSPVQEESSGSPETSTVSSKSAAVDAATAAVFVANDSAGGDLQRSNRAGRAISRTVNCPEGGTAAVAGDAEVSQTVPRTFTLDATATLTACNSTSGVVGIQANGQFEGGILNANINIQGDLANGSCSVVISDLAEQTTIVVEGQGVSGTVSGTVSADCGAGGSVTCTWSNVDINDQAALEAGCS